MTDDLQLRLTFCCLFTECLVFFRLRCASHPLAFFTTRRTWASLKLHAQYFAMSTTHTKVIRKIERCEPGVHEDISMAHVQALGNTVLPSKCMVPRT